VLIFHAELGDQAVLADPAALERSLQTNFNSALRISAAGAEQLARSASPRPVLLAVGSVAGDRGRASNFVYGAAKAGLAAFYQGLAQQHAGGRLRVVLVKPGPVRTPMTEGRERKGPLWAE